MEDDFDRGFTAGYAQCKVDNKELLYPDKKIKRNKIESNIGICSKHQIKDPNCKLCNTQISLVEWISILSSLPQIPEGNHGVTVLIAEYDKIYAEIGNNGYNIIHGIYGSIKSESL